MKTPIKLRPCFEVIKVLDLNEIYVGPHGPTLYFRIEILREYRSKNRYRVRVYRKETFRILPTFPQKHGEPQYEPSDEALYIEDNPAEWEKLCAATPQAVLKKTLAKLTGTFQSTYMKLKE